MGAEGLLRVFDRSVATYEAALGRCRDTFGEEAVHDLRVAIRRLLTVIDLLRSPGFDLRARRLRRSLKRQLAALGELRDTQVMLQRLETVWMQWPDGRDFRQQLLLRQRRQLAASRKVLAAIDRKWQGRRLRRLRDGLAVWQGDAAAVLQGALDAAHQRWHTRHVGMCSGLVVDSALLDRLHRERVAFKRLRYTVGILQQLDPGLCDEKTLASLGRHQTLLGDIQDARVLCRALQDRGRTLPARV